MGASGGSEDSGAAPNGARDGQGKSAGHAGPGALGDARRVLASWAPQLERYLRRRAGRAVLERESAADLAQSVCREALERLGRGDLEYRGEAELRKWLLGAADHKVQNRLRRRGALKRGDEQLLGEARAEELVHATEPTPSGTLAQQEDREAFLAALAQLDERQRRCVELFHFEGLTHREIAARLGVTEGHSRTLLARSLARLTELLRGGG